MSKRDYAAVLVLAAFLAACTTLSTESTKTEPRDGGTSLNTATDTTGRGTNTFGSGN